MCYQKLNEYMRKPLQLRQVLLHEMIHLMVHPFSGKRYLNEYGRLRQEMSYVYILSMCRKIICVWW